MIIEDSPPVIEGQEAKAPPPITHWWRLFIVCYERKAPAKPETKESEVKVPSVSVETIAPRPNDVKPYGTFSTLIRCASAEQILDQSVFTILHGHRDRIFPGKNLLMEITTMFYCGTSNPDLTPPHGDHKFCITMNVFRGTSSVGNQFMTIVNRSYEMYPGMAGFFTDIKNIIPDSSKAIILITGIQKISSTFTSTSFPLHSRPVYELG